MQSQSVKQEKICKINNCFACNNYIDIANGSTSNNPENINIFSFGGTCVEIKNASCLNILSEISIDSIFKGSIAASSTIKITFAALLQNEIHSQNLPKADFSIFNTEFFLKRNSSIIAQLLQWDDNKENILWKLSIDSEFSIFDYTLTAETAEDNNFEQLIFSRFLLQHTFINHHGLIIHAAGGSIHGKGMVFPAVSGTGKSTLSHLLLPFSENQLYSEERIIMRRMNDGWQLWGTPWKGTGVIARNESAPLSALVFLSQAPQTKISELAPSAALRRLLETVSIPWYSQEWTDKGLAVCESLLQDIPAFELAFRPDQTAVQTVADLAALLP